MNYESQVYDAWLASAEMPGEWLIPLLHEKKSSYAVYHEFINLKMNMEEMIPCSGRSRLLKSAEKARMDFFHNLIMKQGIGSITIEDSLYPHILRELPDPPGILFYQGEPGCLKNSRIAAMIGCRSATYKGLNAARRISKELSSEGVTIISGLAYGIDSECHRGCIEGGSPTIAVTGGGLDQMYPLGNEQLKNDILTNGGLIITEYAPGTRPTGMHFPYRNRIISGLASVVILMEARIRSGSMTTIGHALKQGKDIYAYPGDPESPMTDGNRLLLREGARYFTEAKDILDDMNWLDNQSHVRQNSDCSAAPSPDETTENPVFKALLKGELGFDELILDTGMTSSALMSMLTIMQIKGRIELLPGKKYRLTKQ